MEYPGIGFSNAAIQALVWAAVLGFQPFLVLRFMHQRAGQLVELNA